MSTAAGSSVPSAAAQALLKPWTGNFGGLPPWSTVQAEAFVPAFQEALTEATAEVQRIAEQSEAATFANTVEEMERMGKTLDALKAIFGVHVSNLNTPAVAEAEKVVMPKLAEFSDSIIQNEKLFHKVEQVWNHDGAAGIDGTKLEKPAFRLLERRYKEFVRNGARLSADQKKKLSEINQRLATLFSEFNQHILEEEKEVTWIYSEGELAGLPESLVGALKQAAVGKGKPDLWCVPTTRSFVEQVLEAAVDRSLRERVFNAFIRRGDNDNEHNTSLIIREILELRASRAELLGYPSHAHWRMEPNMARHPETALQLLMKVWPKAVARVQEEVAEMQALAKEEGFAGEIEPWDYRFYAEKLRKAKYDLDFGEVTPYLECDQLRQAAMWCAETNYGIQFVERPEIEVYHPDVRVWEVRRLEGPDAGQTVGLFYFDPYSREGKRSGAWMTEYRTQHFFDKGALPIVSNNSNFIKAPAGQPTLVSYDDAITLFHEFGHGLHGLLSRVKYPGQAGTNVSLDFVELPSQINERWFLTEQVLSKFALHHETKQPIPTALVDKIMKASKFRKGFDTVEYLSCAILDLQLHMKSAEEIDSFNATDFEAEALKAIGMPKQMVLRHRLPHFSHLFADDGYSAGYYSYMWADVLVADAAEAFQQALGGFFDKTLAAKFRDEVLSRGDSEDAATCFRNFRGRDPDPSALFRFRGFPTD